MHLRHAYLSEESRKECKGTTYFYTPVIKAMYWCATMLHRANHTEVLRSKSQSQRCFKQVSCFLMKLQALLFAMFFFPFLFFFFLTECRLFIQFQRSVLHHSSFNLVLQKCALNRWLRLCSPVAIHIHILFIALLETEFLLLVSNETTY